MITSGMMSSKTPEHYTPPSFLERVEMVAPIRLDPCAALKSRVHAARRFFLPQYDGLKETWAAHLTDPKGLVFVNPPYGREVGDWTAKMALEAQVASSTILALLPARTDARWFQEAARTADMSCFLAGRLSFWTDQWCPTCWKYKACTKTDHTVVTLDEAGEGDCAPFPSVVLFWSPDMVLRDRFQNAFCDQGLTFDHRR